MKKLSQGRGIVVICSLEGFFLVAVSVLTKYFSRTPYGSQGADASHCWHGSFQTSTNLPKPSMCVFLVGTVGLVNWLGGWVV